MNAVAGLDAASRGSAYIGDTNLSQLSGRELTALRRDRWGSFSSRSTSCLHLQRLRPSRCPPTLRGKVDAEWFGEVTRRLGVTERLRHRHAELLDGQQQRVACARAPVARLGLMSGDESTGNLDSNASREVLEILRTAVDQDGQTVVIGTHDARAASYADRVIFLRDGNIVDETRDSDMDSILRVMEGMED